MTTRRHFLSALAAGTAALASSAALPSIARGAGPAPRSPALVQSPQTPTGRYRPPYRLGLGGSPLGNASSIAIDGAEALSVLEAAWAGGIRYYDTSPFYGFGLSERRFGRLLHEKKREDYVLSTKVGRLFHATAAPRKSAWANPSPFDYDYDYSASGTRRSIEDSLQRLGISSIDIAFIHDLSPDNPDLGERWTDYLDQALKGAVPELEKMKAEGLIKAWGLGVNTLPPLLRTLERADPDIFLSACNYTLIDHAEALDTLFPLCEPRGVSIVVGSPLNNGFLAGRDRFNYAGDRKPNAQQLEKRRRLETVATAHGVDLRTAALQFCSAPAVVSAVIPGARRAHQPGENVASLQVAIPAGFWAELKHEKLIAENAPVPSPV
ncbi:L-fucose dehydrogenase [Opitutaceae bacterium TAV5]|nr:L-fucose dehydrogenase [Opitutaceae bacterium TAV5]